jgi:hypothetical protein
VRRADGAEYGPSIEQALRELLGFNLASSTLASAG